MSGVRKKNEKMKVKIEMDGKKKKDLKKYCASAYQSGNRSANSVNH